MDYAIAVSVLVAVGVMVALVWQARPVRPPLRKCAARTPDPDGVLWRASVRRLAAIFLADRQETAADFDWDRRCDACGRIVALNVHLYPAGTPFRCGDSLYDPSVARDGYWWASAVAGVDPDAAVGATIPPARRAYLEEECAAHGLRFGGAKA